MDISWKCSITLSSFKIWNQYKKLLRKVENQGFDIVEVYGEPDLIDVKSLSHQLDSFSIGVSGITGMWGLSSSESRFRNLVTTNNNSLKACSELCKKMRYSLPEAQVVRHLISVCLVKSH